MHDAPEHDWSRIMALLDAAWDLEPEERAAFLAEECAGEPAIRKEVEALLEAEAQAPDFLEGDAASFVGAAYADALEEDEPSHCDRRIGPYRLIDEIGRGGMSRIFRAERVDGAFEHEVAVKLLRIGLDSEEARQRFRLEQQVLATLEHPNIARLLDGGLTDDDVPYLVMEHVDGQPITDYCAAHQCSVEERLQLLATVGEALQYAHRNLVVHRDLKPSNILITESGTVKLLDFGIAKLLDAEAAAFTVPATRTGIRPMTPGYAAPEQVRGHAVSAATDVYQLGVLAYELLTGQRPYEAAERSPFEVERAVLKETPDRPSTVVHQSAAPAEEKEAEVEAPDEDLAQALRGDLDAIVMKALRKEPEARYASAEAFVADLKRHCAGRPVDARTPTVGYRLKKFVRRHAVGVATSAVALLLVGAFIVVLVRQQAQMAEQRDRAQTEARKAEQVSEFLVSLFGAAGPRSGGGSLNADEVLDQGQRRIQQLEGYPVVQAQMLDAMGQSHARMGHYDTADSLLRRALALRRKHLGSNHSQVAESFTHIGNVKSRNYQDAAAVPLYRKAMGILDQDKRADPVQRAETMEALAKALRNVGEPDSAETLMRKALTRYEMAYGSDHPEVWAARGSLAYILRKTGEYAQAESLYRSVLANQQERWGEAHADVAITLNNLGYLLREQGRLAEAERFYRRALAAHRDVYGEAHQRTNMVRTNNLLSLLYDQQEYDEAEALLRDHMQIIRTHYAADSWRMAEAHELLGGLFADRQRLEDARTHLQRAVEIYTSSLGADHPWTADARAEFGHCLLMLGETSAGARHLTNSQSVIQATHPDSTTLNVSMAQAQVNVGLGYYHFTQKDFPRAESLLTRGYTTLKEAFGDSTIATRHAARHLAALYDAWGKVEAATTYRQRVVAAGPSQ